MNGDSVKEVPPATWEAMFCFVYKMSPGDVQRMPLQKFNEHKGMVEVIFRRLTRIKL